MLLPFLVSKIHNARVTGTDLNYSGSIGIDEDILKQAGLREFQKVEIYNMTNGNRLSTYIILEKPGSRKITLNGAAAHLVSTGDIIIIAAYALLDERELNSLNSLIMILDENNNVEKIIQGKL
jgi:aspartate 1-decarboxylase